jgi:hydroxymethylpyrimidine kinase / phosphomethylpyrimidine kinase / thiamine-phosphate diphosphorylase
MKHPIVWSIAGSDSGAGAGLQADLKTFEAFGVHGCTVVAAITAQSSVTVTHIEAVSPEMLDAQLAALAVDMPPATIKTGMLGSAANLYIVAKWVDKLREANPALALVVDPVLGATTGASFADEALLAAYREVLLPRTTIATPNAREASLLFGCEPLASASQYQQAAQAIQQLGCQNVVITGGDVLALGGDAASNHCSDYALTTHTHAAFEGWLSLPRVDTPHNHGTGCVFAASCAAALALGFVPIESVVLAKMATTHALRSGYAAGAGAGPVRPRDDFAQHIQNVPSLDAPFDKLGANGGFPALLEPDMGLYVIVDSSAWVERVLAAGVKTVQLRIKDVAKNEASLADLRNEIKKSITSAQKFGAQLFINDHWQLAMEEGAYGVHIGQEDLGVIGKIGLQAIADAGLRLGISTHAYYEVAKAWQIRPSYIACGPIHPTAAKAMPWIPQGNDNLSHWCRLLPLPVVAIAGMDSARATEAAACGAASVAVISAVTAAADPEGVIRELQTAIALGRALPKWPMPNLARSTLALDSRLRGNDMSTRG